MKTRAGREKKKLNKLRADDGLFDLGKLWGVENGRDEVHVNERRALAPRPHHPQRKHARWARTSGEGRDHEPPQRKLSENGRRRGRVQVWLCSNEMK
jgi:hypothetical protein